jgi:uncharacterized protein YggE
MQKIIKNLIMLIACTAVFAYAEPELKGSPNELRGVLHPQGNIVTIRESAEKKAYSDIAIVSVLVTTESKLLSEALSANSALREALSKQLLAGGIKAEHINSSKFSSSPQYGWFGKKPSSYKVVNRLALKLFDERQLELVAKLADQNIEVEFSGTRFEHSEKEVFKKQVHKNALARIADKKAFYENSLGIKLDPISVGDVQQLEQATEGARMLEEMVVTAQRSGADSFVSKARYAPAPAPATSFDEVVYKANISVSYKVRSSASTSL